MDHDKTVEEFIRKHANHIYTNAEHTSAPITTDELRDGCIHARRSAGGLDDFELPDFALLSRSIFKWIAALLNTVEEGAPWPKDVADARAAFLAEDVAKLEDLLAYRVLLILPVLYRRWAYCRLRSMTGWVQNWQLREMYVGVASAGAEDTWYETALDFELVAMKGIHFAGIEIDIFMCFDQIIRALVYRIAKIAGMPSNILAACRRYQEGMRPRNSVAGGLGRPYPRRCGIPQGCPMSMMFITLILRVWIFETRRPPVKTRDLADDVLAVAHGEHHFELIVQAMEDANEYFQDMGARVAHNKSILFRQPKRDQEQVEEAQMGVRSNHSCGKPFKGSRSTPFRLTQVLLQHAQRMRKGITMTRKVHRLPVKFKKKASIIRTKVIPTAPYACEASAAPHAAQMTLASEIKQAISTSSTHKSTDFTFTVASYGKDLDLESIILCRRTMLLRRMTAKKPMLMDKFNGIIKEYIDMDYVGTDSGRIHEGRALAAPMPGQPCRQAWKPLFRPQGPIGLLLAQVHEKAAAIDEHWTIHQHNEPPLDIMKVHIDKLKAMTGGVATRARTAVAMNQRLAACSLREIDKAASLADHGAMDERSNG